MATPLPGDAVVWREKPVVLKASEESRTGFFNVHKLRENKKGTTYVAKFVPEGEKA